MKRKKGASRILLSIVFILLILLAIALFVFVGKRLIEKLFLGGI